LILEFLYFICQVASGRTLQSNFVVFKSSCHLPLSSTGVTNLSETESNPLCTDLCEGSNL